MLTLQPALPLQPKDQVSGSAASFCVHPFKYSYGTTGDQALVRMQTVVTTLHVLALEGSSHATAQRLHTWHG